MSIILFANNAGSTLAGGITNIATTANLASGSGVLFPAPTGGQYFVGTFTDAATGLLNEIVHVTNVTGDVITMVRAQEGTTGLNWLANDLFNNNWTAGQASAIESQQAQPLGFLKLKGSAAGGTVTASWTADQVIAAQTLSGTTFLGTSLTLSFNGAGTGVNGMDIGSIPAAADLSVYAIYNPSTATWATLGCAGTTSNGAIYSGVNMPSGYVGSLLIWSGKTSSSNILAFDQFERQISIALLQLVSLGSPTTPATINCSAVFPVNAKTASGNFGIPTGVGTVYLAGNSTRLGLFAVSCTNSGAFAGAIFTGVAMVVPQSLYYYVDQSAEANVFVSGYSI